MAIDSKNLGMLGLTEAEAEQFQSELAQMNAVYNERRKAQLDDYLAERKGRGGFIADPDFQGPRDRFTNDPEFRDQASYFSTPQNTLDAYNQDYAALLNKWGVSPVIEGTDKIYYLDNGVSWANPYGESARFNDPQGTRPGLYTRDARTEGDFQWRSFIGDMIKAAPIVALTGPIAGLLGGGTLANAAAAGLTSAGSQYAVNGEIDPLATLLSAGTGGLNGVGNSGFFEQTDNPLNAANIQNAQTTAFMGARGTVDFEDMGNGTASDVLENTRWQGVIEGLPPMPAGGWKWEDIKNLPRDALEKIESVIKGGGSLLPGNSALDPSAVVGAILGTQYPDAPWDWGQVANGVLTGAGTLADILGGLGGDEAQPTPPVTGEPTQPGSPVTGEPPPTQQPPATGEPPPTQQPPATGTPAPGEPPQPQQPPVIGEPTPGENPLNDPATVGPNPAFGDAASIALLTGLLDTPDSSNPLQPGMQYQGPDRSWGIQRPDYGQPNQQPLFNFPTRPNQPIQVAPNPQPLPGYLDPLEAERQRRQQMTGLLG